MGIVDEDIAKVRQSIDLVALIGEHTEIKKSGRSWMARCPMHGERTPSLSISPEKGVYFCFGCQRSGDALTFVQEMENLDFAGAVEYLAGRAGVTLRYTSRDEGESRARKRRLLDAVDKAASYYHDRLLSSSDAGPARGYLRARGYDGETVRRYRIGWAPDDWDQLARHLKLADAELRDSGLGFVNKRGRQQDAFRGRVMFPITDDRGDVVGFGGRILPGGDGPKYKNTSTDSSVYDKSRVLYGLHDHRESIVKAGEAIICEGYTDVIGFAGAGVERAVATCGTALTEQHVKLLKRFSADRLVLAFDADAAGLAAAERVYAWEKEFGLDVRVADLPAGVDPADLARESPTELERAVDQAVPFLAFRLERVLAAGGLDTVEGRARTAESALAVVAEHPDPLVVDQYVVEIADRCRVDGSRLREMLASGVGTGTRSALSAGAEREVPNEPDDGDRAVSTFDTRLTAEDELLRLAIHRGDELLSRLDAVLFGDPMRREAFEAFASTADVVAAGEQVSSAASALLHRLAVDAGDVDEHDVLSVVLRLTAQRVMVDLQRSARTTTSADQQQVFTQAIAWLKQQIELLAERDTRQAALDVLLPWIIEHGAGRGA